MVEKLAAAGVKGKHVQDLHRMAAECLRYKHEYLEIAESLYSSNGIDLFSSSRPLLWLWRFSARQTKPKGPASESPNDESTMMLSSISSQIYQRFPPFQDPERPLIADVGCGMGVSLLGLASISQKEEQRALQSSLKDIDFGDCNFLGADLSQLAIGYGLGISMRRGLGDRLQYLWASAEDLLERIDKEYKGPIALIMIQFPTPYRLKDGGNDDGNSQLPMDQESGFMVSRKLLGKVKRLLSKSGGRLLLQSNCEDVAVAMRSTAEQCGMQIVEISDEVESILDQHQTLRNLEWAKQGGERAIGCGWAANQLLPPMGKTETEISCELQGTPIHRCLLSAS
jgi:SAM-dependent methyltransferase